MAIPLTHETIEDAVLLTTVDKKAFEALTEKDAPLKQLAATQGFEPKFGQVLLVTDAAGLARQALLGTDSPPNDPRSPIHLFAKAAAKLPPHLSYRLDSEKMNTDALEFAAIGWGLAAYRFTRYRKDSEKAVVGTLSIGAAFNQDTVKHVLEAVFKARDLINTPAGDLSPGHLAEEIREIGKRYGAEVTVIEGDDLLEKNFPAVHAVGRAATTPPVLVDLRWGNPNHPKLTLVGKGVVFDSGGLDLKSPAGMGLMKKDMGGAAVTTALAQAIMAEQLPVRLRLLVPSVENAVAGNSYRPGDVIDTRKGLKVEINNTDAEGRVILCDALTEAVSEDPDLLIDMATLTGACRTALGEDLPGFWTEVNDLAENLCRAAAQAGDPLWRMPLWHPYTDMLKSDIADLSNCATSGFAGSVTAALYLHEFVKPFNNWIHFDIFGWRKSALPGSPSGGEATALRAVFKFLSNRYPKG